MPVLPGVNYSCARCRKPITQWVVIVRPDGKLSLTAHCHGETAEILMYLGIGGVLFEGSPYAPRPAH